MNERNNSKSGEYSKKQKMCDWAREQDLSLNGLLAVSPLAGACNRDLQFYCIGNRWRSSEVTNLAEACLRDRTRR